MKDVDLDKLTLEAEAGNGEAIKKVLDDAGSVEERLRILRTLDRLNEENRKTNPAIPDLDIVHRANGGQVFLHVVHNPPGWFNSQPIYSEDLDLKTSSRKATAKKR